MTDLSLGILRNLNHLIIHIVNILYHTRIDRQFKSTVITIGIGEAGNTGQDDGGDQHQDEH